VDVNVAKEPTPAAFLNSITSYGKMMQELDRGSVLRSWSPVDDTAPDDEILDDSVDESLACMECKSDGAASGKHASTSYCSPIMCAITRHNAG
jgi:hypothetical protein